MQSNLPPLAENPVMDGKKDNKNRLKIHMMIIRFDKSVFMFSQVI